jgi:hypothetical protein
MLSLVEGKKKNRLRKRAAGHARLLIIHAIKVKVKMRLLVFVYCKDLALSVIFR